MTVGLQVFNADGSLQFDNSTQLMRAVSAFSTGTSNGSLNISGLSALGTPVFLIVSDFTAGQPVLSASGDTVSWAFSAANTANKDTRVLVVVK